MALRDRFRELASGANEEVLGLFNRYERGGLSRSDFVAAAAAAIARAEGRAVRTADRGMAVQLSRLLRREIRPEPTQLDEQQPRLTGAMNTLLDAEIETATTPALLIASQKERISRLAHADVLQVAQRAVQRQLQVYQMGWVRRTGSDPCPLCQEWDDGVVRPADVEMAHHVSCSCVQEPAKL